MKLDKGNAVSVGTTAVKPYRSICPVGLVWFARYCGKMYSHHLFSCGGLGNHVTSCIQDGGAGEIDNPVLPDTDASSLGSVSTEIRNKTVFPTIKRPFALRVEVSFKRKTLLVLRCS